MPNAESPPVAQTKPVKPNTAGERNSTLRSNAAAGMSHAELDKKLAQLAATARKSLVKCVEAVLQLAAVVAEANATLACKGRGSDFGRWVTEDVGISRSQAYELVRMHATWSGYEHANRFSLTALAKLASGPKEAVEEAKQLAAAGQNIPADEAERLISRHSRRPPLPKTVRISVDGLATVVLHGRKNADNAELTRLQQAIERAISSLADELDQHRNHES